MDRDEYKRWADHPVRNVLRSAAQHDARYLPSRSALVEQLTDAGIPANRHGAIIEAATKVARTGTSDDFRSKQDAQRMADELSLDFVRKMTADDSLLGDGSHTRQVS